MAARDPNGDESQTIRCIYCQMPQNVSRRALTLTCKFCNKTLKIEALTVKNYLARRAVETCGPLTVERNGQIVSDRIVCGSLVVRGRIKSDILCHGPMLVSPEAQIRGDVTASSLAVGEGADLQGRYRVGPMEAQSGETSQPPPKAL
jgi:Polymer-forming cytoskeletal